MRQADGPRQNPEALCQKRWMRRHSFGAMYVPRAIFYYPGEFRIKLALMRSNQLSVRTKASGAPETLNSSAGAGH